MLLHFEALVVELFLLTKIVLGAPIDRSEKLRKRDQLEGISVSFNENGDNWQEIATNHSFAYIVATGGYGYANPDFSSQFTKAGAAGLFRGAYHIAIFESKSSGVDQANYFVANGGNKVDDGKTLPGAVKVGFDTDDDNCYNWDSTSIVNWIHDFSTTYHDQVGRYPVIHTTAHWWNTCTNNDAEFGSNNPLWIVHQGDSVETYPAGWTSFTFWQYANPVPNADGKERFNGDEDGLKRLAADWGS